MEAPNIQAKQSQYLHQIRFMQDKPSIITNLVLHKLQIYRRFQKVLTRFEKSVVHQYLLPVKAG